VSASPTSLRCFGPPPPRGKRALCPAPPAPFVPPRLPASARSPLVGEHDRPLRSISEAVAQMKLADRGVNLRLRICDSPPSLPSPTRGEGEFVEKSQTLLLLP